MGRCTECAPRIDAMDIAELLLGPLTVETDTASSKMEEGDDDVMKKDIRELKENVQKMMGQMGQLLEVITRVEALSTKVNKNEERVKKVEEMVKEDRDEIKLLREQNEHLVGRVAKMEARLEGQEEKVGRVTKIEARLEGQEEKSVDLEARSRRNNGIFHGVAEVAGEDKNWELSKGVALQFIKEKCKVSAHVKIERAHRIPTKRRDNAHPDKPRPLIVKFLDYNDKMLVKKSRTNLPADGGFGISDDLPLAVRQARRRLHDELEFRKSKGDEVWIQYPARLFANGTMIRDEPVIAEERQQRRSGGGANERHDNNMRPNYNDRRSVSSQDAPRQSHDGRDDWNHVPYRRDFGRDGGRRDYSSRTPYGRGYP